MNMNPIQITNITRTKVSLLNPTQWGYFIETFWWKITHKKDPLIKFALKEGIITETKDHYLLEKDWNLNGIKMGLDKPFAVRQSHNASLNIENCVIIKRSAKYVFDYLV